MKLLNEVQIKQKVKRLSIQILEENIAEQELILAGLNNNGLNFAEMLMQTLDQITPSHMNLQLTRIKLNPADPTEYEPFIEMPLESMQGKAIILVDDVANTGRTIFYAIKPLLRIVPKKVEVAVLVDRQHKSFPIKADYVGISLATTMQDHIEVQLDSGAEMAVYLE